MLQAHLDLLCAAACGGGVLKLAVADAADVVSFTTDANGKVTAVLTDPAPTAGFRRIGIDVQMVKAAIKLERGDKNNATLASGTVTVKLLCKDQDSLKFVYDLFSKSCKGLVLAWQDRQGVRILGLNNANEATDRVKLKTVNDDLGEGYQDDNGLELVFDYVGLSLARYYVGAFDTLPFAT